MRIIVCHNFDKQPSREDRVFRDEAALLESYGHQVLRFTAYNDSADGFSQLAAARLAVWNRRSSRMLRDLVIRRRAEVVHFHNTSPLISPAAYYGARAAGAAVVQSLHNFRLTCPKGTLFRNGGACESCLGRGIAWPSIVHGCYSDSRTASAAMTGMLAIHGLLGTYRRAVDAYVAPSQFARDKLVQAGLPAERVALKPPLVSPAPFLTQGHGGGRGGYALYVGRLAVEQGVDVLLAAWRRLPRTIPLKLVGEGPLAGEARALSRRNPAIEHLPGRDDAEVRALLGDASLLVLPLAAYDSFPSILVETFAAGTPVVAARQGAVVEFVEVGRTGRQFTPGDAEELAAQATSLFFDAARLSDMRRACRDEYQQKYTAQQNYQALIGIYQQALQVRHGASRKPIGTGAVAPGASS